MLLNYLKVAFRNLARHRLYAVINMIGLSIGVTCCIVILLFIQQELSYDRFNANAGSLYRVTTITKDPGGETTAMAFEPMPLIPALKADYPEIARAARLSSGGVVLASGDKAFSERVMFTDPDIFDMFDIRFLKGNPGTALRQPNDIVITPAVAARYFGAEDPMGKTLIMRTRAASQTYTVAAIVAPMPENSSLRFEILANITQHSMYPSVAQRWTSSNGSAFVMLAPGTKVNDLEQKLPGFVARHLAEVVQHKYADGHLSSDPGAFRLHLQPLEDIHLDTSVQSSPEQLGKPVYLFILGGLSLLVLSIACINFVTLTVGRSANRAKEVGLRKVLGAVRPQLVRQLWGEALILCTAALFLALTLAEVALPAVNNIFGKHLSLNPLDNPGLACGLFGLLVLVGTLAGVYPALLLSRFQPVEVLKGRFKVGGGNRFTKFLVVLQFGLSIFLVCLALVLAAQTRFMITASLGFKAQQVLVVPTHAANADQAQRLMDRFRTLVAGNPGVLNVSITSGAFTHGYDISGFQYNGQEKSTYVYRVDEEYLSTLGIPLKDGRNFEKGSAADQGGAMIVNEAFLRSMGWAEPALGRRLAGTDVDMLARMEIIGVVKDFHFASMQEEIAPLILFMNPQWPLDEILVRISPSNVPAEVDDIRAAWTQAAPATPFDATFMDEDFQKLYDGEMRWGRIISSASVLAVCLACLGLFGLATLAVTNRTKEIGIRKVLGAGGISVLSLVSKDFLRLVVLANIIAWPAAWYAASRFLQGYAYRIELTPWMFLAAGAGALTIAFLVIAGQIARAVRANPVDALRYE